MSSDRRSALVIAGAPVTDSAEYAELVTSADVVVAVDAGAELCMAHGRVPDYLIGDLDSISSDSLAKIRTAGSTIHSLRPEKDFTDLDAALDLCERMSLDAPLTVTAVTLGREDHFLGVCGSLARHASLAPVIREPHVSAWVLNPQGCNSVSLGPQGATFSLLAILDSASVSIAGARYPLDEFEIEPMSTRGISNEVSEESARIVVHSGTVIVLASQVSDKPTVRQIAVAFADAKRASL